MLKIYVTRQFFEVSGPQGNFFEKKNKKKPFYIRSRGEYVQNFRSVSFLVWSGGGILSFQLFPTYLKFRLRQNNITKNLETFLNMSNQINLFKNITLYSLFFSNPRKASRRQGYWFIYYNYVCWSVFWFMSCPHSRNRGELSRSAMECHAPRPNKIDMKFDATLPYDTSKNGFLSFFRRN